jgi:predicted dehydrogenase/nucleoside-diphosphate-sugar epimerase
MVRVAFIGAGHMADHHLRALGRLAVRSVVVGVHDRMTNRAEGFGTRAACRAFPTVEALLRDARPDIVHVCTPPAAHFETAAAALEGGAHVYVEKPFAMTVGDGRTLIDLAHARRRLVCAGHQLLRDRAFGRLLARAGELGSPVQVDSHFAFRPSVTSVARSGAATFARHLVDILPHPLYSLVSVLERFTSAVGDIELAWVHADPADLQAVLRAGDVTGRLSVSLRARPVASSLTLTGTRGSLTCDFVRSIVLGSANPGTEALEKVLNPMSEGAQLLSRTASSVAARVCSSGSYPGLVELIEEFYRAVETGGSSPVSSAHLLQVTDLFEQLVARIEAAARQPRHTRPCVRRTSDPRLVVVTGARGFLGAEIARALTHVRGIGRGGWPDDPLTGGWVAADLSNGLAAEAVAGADVVVHAAAETSGGYAEHQRNTIDATRHLLRAMHAARVRRLVLVSSLSVIRPPRTPWECQDEGTPRPRDPRLLGPYTWGKCLQEEIAEREAAALGIAIRIVRPGALVDWLDPVLPGVMGRRLFGRWHLGLGRPSLPVAVCDVERCAQAIAWCAANFEKAPPIVNLLDPVIATRRDFVNRLRAGGWTGRILWVPISVVALGLTAARVAGSLCRGRWPDGLAVWSVLRSRRYDTRLAAQMLEAAWEDDRSALLAEVATSPARRTPARSALVQDAIGTGSPS